MDRLTTYWSLRNNSIENVRKSLTSNFPSIESECEAIGQILYSKIEKNEIPLRKIIEDILQYVQCKNKQDRSSKTKREMNRHFRWLILQIGLGFCCRGWQVITKDMPRKILYELLRSSGGVDFAIFLRDLFEREGNITSSTQYILSICAGFTIKFTDYIFICPHGEVWLELLRGNSCQYLDLPIAQSSLPPDVDVTRTHLRPSPLLLAIVNMKPTVVLLLLRHGATASGQPVDYILRMFGSLHSTASNYAQPGTIHDRVQVLTDCFVYCLRTIPHLTLRFGSESAVNIPRRNVYYVREEVTSFFPPFYTCPFSLQHLCRCALREALIDRDQIPHGIAQLRLPDHLQAYLDLLC